MAQNDTKCPKLSKNNQKIWLTGRKCFSFGQIQKYPKWPSNGPQKSIKLLAGCHPPPGGWDAAAHPTPWTRLAQTRLEEKSVRFKIFKIPIQWGKFFWHEAPEKNIEGVSKKRSKKEYEGKIHREVPGKKANWQGVPREPPLGPEGGVQTLPLAPMAWVAWGGGGQTFPCAKTTPHCGLSAPPMGK